MRILICSCSVVVLLTLAWPVKAEDPPVTVTVTTTVPETIRGCDVHCWMHHARREHKAVVKRGRTISRLHHVLRRSWQSLWPFGPFMCIHSFEGSWTDGGFPFWGGLQMDRSFQSTYGGWAFQRWGTADRWPPAVQLSVAVRAFFSGRGFWPWPNTARRCGLLG